MSLNKKQRDAIEIMIATPFIKKQDVAKQVGVHPNTFTQWLKKEEFCAEWDKRLAEEWKDSIRNAQRKMNELVEQGDYRAIQYVLDSGGFKPAEKVDINSDNGITVNINYGDKDNA